MKKASVYKNWTNPLLVGVLLGIVFLGKIQAQGGIIIGSGAQVVASGSPRIVVTNGKWENNGTFTAASSTVQMEGNATTANSTIGGSSATTFFHLTQQKTANDIRLDQNIGVNGNLSMNGGLFQLNNFVVTLGTASGQILNESEINRITGTTGGEIVKTMTLTVPVTVNPGNLGAEISSFANLGSTMIRRGHVQQQDGNTGISIFRYYDIFPTNNSGLNATLSQYYFDAELGAMVETEMVHFNNLTPGGTQWYDRGFTSRNIVSNFVTNTGYDDFTRRWTLASSINNPLPVVFLDQGIRCETPVPKLFWTVLETSVSDYFEFENSDDQVTWKMVANVRVLSKGQGQNRYEIPVPQTAQYYRIRQIDMDGTTMKSEDVQMQCGNVGFWEIWPTPTQNALHIRAPYGLEIKSLEVCDLLGKVVLREDLAAQPVPETKIELESKLPAAVYVIKIYPVNGDVKIRKFELQR